MKCYYGISRKYVKHSELSRVLFLRVKFMKKTCQEVGTEKKETIWRDKHVPLKNRKTSSGVTFWPEKVKKNE